MSGLFPTKCDIFQFEKNLVAATLFRSRLFRRRSSSFAFFILDYYFPDYYSFAFFISDYYIPDYYFSDFRIAFHLSLDDSTRNCEHGVMEVAFHVLTNSHYILTCIEFIWKFARLSAAEEGREVAANTFSSSSSPPPPSLHPPPPPPPSSPPPPPSTPQDSSNFTCP